MLSLAGYATLFLATFSNIKDGTATEEEIGKTINILTYSEPINHKTATDNIKFTGTAYDAQFFRYVSNGNSLQKDTAIDESAEQYQIGATGAAADIYESMDNEFVNNPISEGFYNFQETIGSSIGWQILTGIGFIIIGVLTGGASLAVAAGAWIQEQALGFAIGKLMEQAMGYLTRALVASMAGMVINSLTAGEDAGNAIVAGAGVFLMTSAMKGGNAPMTKNAALAYIDGQNTFIAQRGREIEATHSPFDITTRHTIMGRINFAMLPYKARFVSFMGSIGSIFNIAKTSLVGLLPSLHAISNQAEIKNAINFCNDPTIKKAMKLETEGAGPDDTEIALTPFCTPIVGIPINYLDSDYFSPRNVLERFGLTDEQKNTMWSDYREGKNLEKYNKPDKLTTFENFAINLRPKDNDGYCNLVEAEVYQDRKHGKNIYSLWTEQEKNNPCNKDWYWTVNDRGYEDSEDGYYPITTTNSNNEEVIKWYKSQFKVTYNKNQLNEFKSNCINRDTIPLGMVDKLPKGDSKLEKANESWASDFFGIEAWKAKSITPGQECLVSGNGSPEDRMRVDFSLYFMDMRVDDILEEGIETK